MAETSSPSPLIVVAGNPNTGKTTLFNHLTGLELKVGNYPGVTIDRHTGHLKLPEAGDVILVDVPGTYSLSARSEEEQIALLATCGVAPYPIPDLVVVVIDATQLTRNLYLTLQLIEVDAPLLVALNMTDMLPGRAERIDSDELSKALGVPVVPIAALKGQGLEELKQAMDQVLAEPGSARPGPRAPFEGQVLSDVAAVEATVPESWSHGDLRRRRAIAAWALLSVDDQDELKGIPDEMRARVGERRELALSNGRDLDAEVVSHRYAWIDAHEKTFLFHEGVPPRTWTQRIDSVLLNPFYGFPLFLAVMGILFQTLFTGADPLIGGVESFFAWISDSISDLMPAGIARDFVTEGLIAGVGSVLVFLPQILLLFLFISVMEATGYMARVAFLMDRVMKMMGLHGRAFVPMLSGFACAIPAIMATRTMERRRERLVTMLVVPLMTCSARLPVYTLIIAALFPPHRLLGMPVQALLMVAMYLFSTLIALLAAAVLSRTILKGPNVPLILELPPYRLPDPRRVLQEMWSKGKVFLSEAGGVILVCTIALWFLLSFPKHPDLNRDFTTERNVATQMEPGPDRDERLSSIDDEEAAARLRASYGGKLGRMIEPVIAPLGFDWKIGIGLIGSFAAREVFVSTMGLVYGVGAEVDESSIPLRTRMRAEAHADGKPVYSPLAGFSLLVFFALACQCMSTVAVVKRETNTWRWPIFMLVYMTGLAWFASFVVYQGGLALDLGVR